MGDRERGGKHGRGRTALGTNEAYAQCKAKEHKCSADKECLIVSCVSTSAGANLEVTKPDGTKVTLKAGENTTCIKLARNDVIVVHNQGAADSVAVGTVIQIDCEDCP